MIASSVKSAWLLFDVCDCCGVEYYPADLLGECAKCKGRPTIAIPTFPESIELTEADVVEDAAA